MESLLAGGDDAAAIASDLTSLAPERAIVFELAGSRIPQFAEKARQIGLEFLFEEQEEPQVYEDFVVVDRIKGEQLQKPVATYFYLAMPSESALRELLRLWQTFKSGAEFQLGLTPWRDLFDHLADLRPWGPQDRISPESVEYFKERFENDPQEEVGCEIELWYSDSEAVNARRVDTVRALVTEAGGRVVHVAKLAEIRYHAMLIRLPIGQVQRVIKLSEEVALVRADDVMFIRPQSAAQIFEVFEGETEDATGTATPVEGGEPIVALLDGMPVQNHRSLAGRLIVDDPDGLEARYATLADRRHGTSMASLILDGDLNARQAGLTRPIYVRPLMCSDIGGGREHFPGEVLLVDYVYRAVRRIFEGEGDAPAAAPTIKIVNLSLGDGSRPFARRMSPWARVIDYLAWRYQVLFTVSAGNVYDDLEFPGFDTFTEMQNVPRDDLEIAVLSALAEQTAVRSLLSPSESINALTVGCAHQDTLTTPLPPNLLDPLSSPGLPAVVSALGLGYRGAVKPEVLVPGGRGMLRAIRSGGGVRARANIQSVDHSGMRSAAPDPQGRLNQTTNSYGTSVATALCTRAGHQIIDALVDDLPEVAEEQRFLPLYAKALLVHHARSDRALYQRLKTTVAQGRSPAAKTRDIARFLGFGTLPLGFEPGCVSECATLIAHGVIAANARHTYRVPVPIGLDGFAGFRAMSVTVAWLSPVNARHQMYRMAKLEASLPKAVGMNGSDVPQIDPNARGKGTIFQARFEGQAQTAVEENASCDVTIECFEQAGPLDDAIPYVIAVSFEVGAEAGIDVYTQIQDSLRVRV